MEFLKNSLMKLLIDIVTNQFFLNSQNTILYLNTLNYIFTGEFQLKRKNKY